MIGIVSFASGNRAWTRAGCRIERQLRSLEAENFVSRVYFDLKELQLDSADLDFAQKHPKGLGYWIWKPYTVLRFLQEHPEVDRVIYLDAGCDVSGNSTFAAVEELWAGVAGKSGLVFKMSDIPEWKFTKKSLASEISATETMMNDSQITASVFCLKREFALEICNQWLSVMKNAEYAHLTDEISDEAEGFVAHRHDQSMLSLIVKKYHSERVLVQDLRDFEETNSWIKISRNRSSLSVDDQRLKAKTIKLCEKIVDRIERLGLRIFRGLLGNKGV